MQQSWSTEKIDIAAATSIMKKHRELNDNEPLAFMEAVIDKEKEGVKFQPSEWVLELEQYFQDKYGYEQGQAITGQIITQCLLKGEVVH